MDSEGPDVATWLRRARERDADAAEAIVEHLYPTVWSVVCRRCPRESDPQDLMQESFLRICRGLESFRGDAASLEPWARRIAFRTCLNAWRHRDSRPEVRWSDLPPEQAQWLEAESDSAQPDGPADQVAAHDLLRSLMASLSPEERLVIELVELEQLEVSKVIELTGWSSVNIRVRRFRARQKLRRALHRLDRKDRDA
jgi:RNA polymerase sigma-70 factor, ECF subfamily